MDSRPRFSWSPNVTRQTGYRIEVSRAGGGVTWDSGEIAGARSIDVPFGANALEPRRRYTWRVKVRDELDNWSRWSDPATWTTGMLDDDTEWEGATWIAGRGDDLHRWDDLTMRFRFRGATRGGYRRVGALLRAASAGKEWNEALHWELRADLDRSDGGRGEHVWLVMSTWHGGGETWDRTGEVPPRWGVDRHDPQSEINPVDPGRRIVDIGSAVLPEGCGLTTATWGDREHAVEIDLRGREVVTIVNGLEVDRRRLRGDQLRDTGTVGFSAGSTALLTSLEVVDHSKGGRCSRWDLSLAHNPFESGIGTSEGLRLLAKNAVLPPAGPAPVLRAATDLPEGEVDDATLWLAVAGIAEVTVNGLPLTVDGRHPEPDGTNVAHLLTDQASYDRTVLYDAFDVTDLVEPGATNWLAVELGRGWYGLTTPNEWYWHLAPYCGEPRFRATLRVRFTNGETRTLTTGPHWRVTDGPTRFDSVYSGERFDARRAERLGDWRRGATTDPTEWRPPTTVSEPGSCVSPSPRSHGRLPPTERPPGFEPARLRAQEAPPVQTIATLEPARWLESAPGSGIYIADFGQIVTGFPRLSLEALAPGGHGWSIRLRGGNELNGRGTTEEPYLVEEENFFHDANLQVDTYEVAASHGQVWQPRFNVWGFRYVELRNLDVVVGRSRAASGRDLLSTAVVRSGFERRGTFASDNPLLDRIVANMEWAQQNNNVGKPTDTPSREKNGWTGDSFADSEAQMIVWDMAAHLTKFLRGFPDGQISTGQLPMILPAAKGGYGYEATPGWDACWTPVPAWDIAFFEIPWELHHHYGADQLLAELYPHQDRLLRYYQRFFDPRRDFLFSPALGAYSGAEDQGDNAAISLQCYIRSADHMVRVGELLGDVVAADHYRRLASEMRRAFVRQWWDPELGHYTGGSTSSQNTLAIAWNLVCGSDLAVDDPLFHPEAPPQRQNEAHLVELLVRRLRGSGHHLLNDIFGSRYELDLLSDHGYVDDVVKAVTCAGHWGFVDQIAAGATSSWEMWDGLSTNHHYRSSVLAWLYRSLAGVRPLAPGYAAVRVRPHVPTSEMNVVIPTRRDHGPLERRPLQRVDAALRTAHGRITSSWRFEPSTRQLTMRVSIPANTTGEVWVPGALESATVSDVDRTRTDRFAGAAWTIVSATWGEHTFTSVLEPSGDGR